MSLPSREEIAEIARVIAGLLSTFPKHANEYPEECLPEAEAAVKELLARLRPAWPTHLPDGALEAIAVEHERDHSDTQALPQAGCNGCKMLSHAFALRADLHACAEALFALCHFVEHNTVKGSPLTAEELGLEGDKNCPPICDGPDTDGQTWALVRAALARPGVRAEMEK